MTWILSDKEIRFQFDARERVIPAGVSEQRGEAWIYAKRKGLANIKRITPENAAVLAPAPVRPLGPPLSIEADSHEEIVPEVPDVEPAKGVLGRIVDAVTRPVSPSR